MTNTELIQKIRAEIERLKGICTAQIKANPEQTFPFVMVMTGYDKILSFLDTLKPEKPVPNEDFEKEIANYWTIMGWSKVMTLAKFKVIARYFYGLGLGVNEKSEKPMQEGLEEELDRFIASGKSVTVEDCGTYKVSYHDFKKVARHFAKWGAEHLKK